jgi:hypothetical protein
MKTIIILLTLTAFLVNHLSVKAEKNDSLTSLEIKTNIEQVLRVLDENYVYPLVANEMRDYVESQVSAGHYDQIKFLETLLPKLQLDIRKVSNDGHISLHLGKGVADRKDHSRALTEAHKDIDTEIITGEKSIAYLKFNVFSNKVIPKERITKAMTMLSSTDSLIIDLRDNEGGDPNLVAFLSSYFVNDNTPLWSVLDRQGNAIIEVVSEQQKLKYQGVVCVLTSNKTYSAAEAFAYTLKHLGRVCIIGETTRGGAHLVQMERVNEKLDIRIPVARAFNPITKTNWEQVGVVPNINVESARAKIVAIDYLQNINR